ncbi:MAG: transcriptional regulator with XRE-family HTH domain [Flavobacterium sp.]
MNKKDLQIQFGNNLRRIRLEKGYTQEQLANELGVEISQISRIERGVISTSIYTLYQFKLVLDIDLNEFFDLSE